MKKHVIIVAGGKGLRMGHDLPKQFIVVGHKPVLMHTIEAFYDYDQAINIVLVLHPSYQMYWTELCETYNFTIPCQVALGGETRFHSVQNGLALIDQDGAIAVHDAARPFVSKRLIERCFESIEIYKAIIPVVDSTDSLRQMLDEGHSQIVDRSKIKAVQTPQVFLGDCLREAYNCPYQDLFTDDASVVEAQGIDIRCVLGERTNIKITTPFDLEIAKIILEANAKWSE